MPMHSHPTLLRLPRRVERYRFPRPPVRLWLTLPPQVQTQLAQQFARALRGIRDHEVGHADRTE